MKPEEVDELARIADNITPNSPFFRHQHFFSGNAFRLIDWKGNFEGQMKKLMLARQSVAAEIFKSGGLNEVLRFAQTVNSPWDLGIAFGCISQDEIDPSILPILLEAEDKSLRQFSAGFILGKFSVNQWRWVDGFDFSSWNPSQIGQFFAYLPFENNVWERISRLLANNQSFYWTKTTANATSNTNLGYAIDRLIENGRPYSAIECLRKLQFDNQPYDIHNDKSLTV